MSLRLARNLLEDLSKARIASTDKETQHLGMALAHLADGLFHEFAALHKRLDQLEAALQSKQTPPDPPTAKP